MNDNKTPGLTKLNSDVFYEVCKVTKLLQKKYVFVCVVCASGVGCLACVLCVINLS
jgi:hypothetical protein